MRGRLEGKICIITGTGGSMGRASALAFSGEGAKIVGCDVNVAAAEETCSMVKDAGGEMHSLHPCDLTVMSDCAALVDLAMQRFGRIDVLFNNAAMAYFDWIGQMSPDTWQKTINEELTLVFNLVRMAWAPLSIHGGSIVNTASASAWLGTKILPTVAHAAAKGGVVAMTRQLATEGAPLGIRVNSISPGVIETNQTRPLLQDPDWAGPMLGKIMLNRLGHPDEVANVALFLASDESSYVTATDIRVDGGMTAW